MPKVLVTGGCGLIGQHICSGLLKKGYDVIATDTEERQHYNTGKLHYTFVECSPTDKDAIGDILDKNDIEILVHAAFTVDNDLEPIVTEKQMRESASCDKFLYRYAMQENEIGTHVKKIILLSTDKVYMFPKTREPINEDSELELVSNYAKMKYASENALVAERKNHKETMCCIIRHSPVYTLKFTDNLMSRITDPRDHTLFVWGKGQYGFQMCCVHNLVEFILGFVQNALDMSHEGYYNVGDRELTKAADIITFMRENHRLGTVVQKSPGGAFSKLKGLFSGSSKEEKRTNYRYLDLDKLENNNMLDKTRASKFTSFRWSIHNTK